MGTRRGHGPGGATAVATVSARRRALPARAWTAVAFGVASFAVQPVPVSAAPPARLRVPGPVGTIDTVAGPGFCPTGSVADPASHAVGALAVGQGAAGSVWFEAGPPGQGAVARVASSVATSVERTGVEAGAGAGGPGRARAASARFASASRLASDGAGGIYVAKPGAVVHLVPGGLTTVAGSRSVAAGGPSSGDGGPVADARFRHVIAIAADGAGNLFVADEVDPGAATLAIRFLNRGHQAVTFYAGTPHEATVAPGTIDTVAGAVSGQRPRRGPELAGHAPVLAVAGAALYVALVEAGSRSRATVQVVNLGSTRLPAHGKVVPPGAAATVATVVAPARAPAGKSGTGAASPLPGISVDGAGSLYLAERARHRVRRLDPAGASTTVAGTGAAGFNGNGRPAVTARLDHPYDVEAAPGGRLYIADAGNLEVRFVDQAGMIHAALGNAAAARSRCVPGGAEPRSASPRTGRPSGLLATEEGDAYVALPELGRIQRLTPSGTLRPLPGGARAGNRAEMFRPAALAARPGGGLYVQDGDGDIHFQNLGPRSLTVHGVEVPSGGSRTVAAGTGVRAHDGALAADRKGNLFFVHHQPVGPIAAGQLRQLDGRGTATTLFPVPDHGRVAGRLDATRCCDFVGGIVLDRRDNLYVAASRRLWYFNRGSEPVVVHGVSVAAGAIEPVAGSAGEGSRDEGIPALEAGLPNPENLALDAAGNLYVLNTFEHTVRRVDRGGTIATVAGTGQRGFNGDGLKAVLTALYQPLDIAIDACGNLLIADVGNDRVRRLNLVASCAPSAGAAEPGGGDRSGPRWVPFAGAAVLAASAILFVVRRSRRRP